MDSQQNLTFWQIVLQIGSVSGLLTLFYTISQNLKKKPKFKFDFRVSTGTYIFKDNMEQYRLLFDGYIKNQSIEPNSITNICYAVWANKSRTRTLSHGGQPVLITLNPNSIKDKINLPISFQPKESKHLQIEFDIVLQGTHDKKIIEALEKVSLDSNFYAPKYQHRLTFKDTNENLFDDQGKIRSQKLMDLWFLLPKTFNELKDGNPFPYIWHMIKIAWQYLYLKWLRLLAFFGF